MQRLSDRGCCGSEARRERFADKPGWSELLNLGICIRCPLDKLLSTYFAHRYFPRSFHALCNMRWLFSILLLALLGAVQALSSSGSRLLVVLEDLAEKDKYSEFVGDLECEYLDRKSMQSRYLGF